MSEPDRRAIHLAGGMDSPMVILPTAAAPDHNDRRAGSRGKAWFSSLGATRVDVVPILSKITAEQAELAERVRQARFIYLLGGFPDYLATTLAGSLAWKAALEVYAAGGVLGGSSAGAMVLCEYHYNPEKRKVVPGLGLLSNTCVIPHHDSFGGNWASRLIQALPEAVLIGIDEQTGILDDLDGQWTVHGPGRVTIYEGGAPRLYSSGETFSLPAASRP